MTFGFGPEAFRQSQVITYRYELTVETLDDGGIEVEVTDEIPISETEDIQVTFLESNREPPVDPQTGKLQWTPEVDEGDRSSITECLLGGVPGGPGRALALSADGASGRPRRRSGRRVQLLDRGIA
jgi:hypothetical protein